MIDLAGEEVVVGTASPRSPDSYRKIFVKIIGDRSMQQCRAESSVAGKEGVGLYLDELSTLRIEEGYTAELIANDLPAELRDRDLLVLVLA